MNKYIYKIGTAATIAGLLGASFAPAVLAETVEISGNGNNSNNTVAINNSCSISLTQKNVNNVSVNVAVGAYTGGNTASGNVGGDVDITTGNATADLNVTVGGSINTATPADCCDCLSPVTGVLISGNGNNSNNTVAQNNSASTSSTQKNKNKVRVRAKVKAKTGKNTSNNNVGGTTSVGTGEATSTIGVTVSGGSNNL
ncbi:hypothetical protein HY382_00335 [Candidatus Curtissbacteria bacterium]|nr:hypothetical protein [Candidatus Curtissbacteria bacterium]